MKSVFVPAVAGAMALLSPFVRAQAAAPSTPGATDAAQLAPVTVTGTASRLDAARNQLSPDTGSTLYSFSRSDIQALPLGSATPLNQVLLRSPGMAQDSFGQLHLRGDHANLQYRIDGVIIPEAITGFGQILDTRVAQQINVITGALPAQYGYRTAGVIDIHTPRTESGSAGSLSVNAGSRGLREIAGDFNGGKDDWTWFVTGSALQSNLGVENPTPDRNALHDTTRQAKGFGYLSRVLDANSRLTLMLGSTDNRFQIPNVPGQSPLFTLNGVDTVNSAALDARQRESLRFQVLTYQASRGDNFDYQLSLGHRYSDVRYTPDPVGDLVFNGIAANVFRKNDAHSLQGDASLKLNDHHTLRAGLFAQRERVSVANAATVFPADDAGAQTSTTPIAIQDNSGIKGRLFGLYLQDQWQVVPALTVNYGARYDKVSSVTNENQLSPRVGLTYDVSATTRVHAGYARYFTPPTTEKIDITSVTRFLGTTNALPSDANTAVSSERSHYIDAGISHQLTDRITLGADAYWRRIQNLQDEGQFGKALIFSAFNYGRGSIGGAELSATYKAPSLTAYGNLGISKARGKEIRTGQFNFAQDKLDYIATNWVHLDHEQKLSASAGASYLLGANRFGADVLFGSGLRRGFANTQHLPGYTQVNASLTHTLDTTRAGKIDLRVAVINLFDRSYQLRDRSGIGVGAPQFGPRRTLVAGVTAFF